jgi:hypothetical protein
VADVTGRVWCVDECRGMRERRRVDYIYVCFIYVVDSGPAMRLVARGGRLDDSCVCPGVPNSATRKAAADSTSARRGLYVNGVSYVDIYICYMCVVVVVVVVVRVVCADQGVVVAQDDGQPRPSRLCTPFHRHSRTSRLCGGAFAASVGADNDAGVCVRTTVCAMEDVCATRGSMCTAPSTSIWGRARLSWLVMYPGRRARARALLGCKSAGRVMYVSPPSSSLTKADRQCLCQIRRDVSDASVSRLC